MTLTIDLPEERVWALEARAQERGMTAERYVEQVVEQDLGSIGERKNLFDRIRERWADIPEEVRAKLPRDGASQHDHYIYGLPKREE